jgi:hypothetical protein
MVRFERIQAWNSPLADVPVIAVGMSEAVRGSYGWRPQTQLPDGEDPVQCMSLAPSQPPTCLLLRLLAIRK